MTLQGFRGIKPALGRYDFDGVGVRVVAGHWRGGTIKPGMGADQQSFSLGIFPFTTRADGGIKRGKAVRRVRGYFGFGDHAPERAFEEAERICEELER